MDTYAFALLAAGVGSPLPDLQYLAGFFDGEGSIGITGESLCVRVVNTYRPILEKFQSAFGGVVDCHRKGDERSRLTWEWRAYGDTAAAALTALLPLLREKAPQAYLGLHYRTLPKGSARVHTRAALSLLKKTTHYQETRP